MARSEHKDIAKDEQKLELPSFYKMADGISSEFTVKLNADSKRLIKRGDAKAIPGNEANAVLGQRYVMVGFIFKNVIHLRAIPGFGFIADVEKREEITKKAMEFFNCDRDHVAFSDHSIWTGMVHSQLISLTKKKEAPLTAAKVIAFSMYKGNGKYRWLNRSVLNADIFPANPLAAACFAFEEKISDKQPEFDLLYHLTRSIPRKYFEDLTNASIEIICKDEFAPLTHTILDECVNFAYEDKWDAIRKLFNTNKLQAIEKIQYLLMRNLHIYLSDLSAPKYKDNAKTILRQGLEEAETLNIPINIDFIPPEFKDDITALEKSKKSDESMMRFLFCYKSRFLYRSFSAAAKEGNIAEVKHLFEKNLDTINFLTSVINTAIDNQRMDIVTIMFAAMPSAQEEIIEHISNCFITEICNGSFSIAEKIIKFLATKTTLLAIQAKLKNLLGDKSEFIPHAAKVIFEEKPNYNKKNANGNTLTQIAIDEEQTDAIITMIEENLVDVEIPDKNGDVCLIHAAKKNEWYIMFILLKRSINPDVKDKEGKSTLEYAMEGGDANLIAELLIRGVQLPESYLNDWKRLSFDLFESIQCSGQLSLIPEMIGKQKNPIIQIQFQASLFNFFEFCLTKYTRLEILALQELLLLPTLPLGSDVVTFNQKKIRKDLLNLLLLETSEYMLRLINAVLDEKSAIGKLILKTEPSLRLFDETPERDFRTYLQEMREAFEIKLYSGHDHTSIP